MKNAQIINYNSNAPIAKTQKHICSFVQKAEVTSQVPEGNEPPNKAVVGETKRVKEDGSGGPYSESGDRASSVSRQNADDSLLSEPLMEAAAQPDSTSWPGRCERLE